MKIAVASNGLDVAQTFAQCQNFSYYATHSYHISATQNIPAQGSTPEEYAELLGRIGVETLLAGEVTPAATEAFQNAGIQLIAGISGRATDAARAYVAQRAAELDSSEEEED